MNKMSVKSLLVAGLMAVSGSAFAAGDAVEAPKQDWSFNGPFGTFERAELQRGFQVYDEVCASCHGMKFLSYRNLGDEGGPQFSEAAVKAIAASKEVEDGPDDAGDMFTREGKPFDRFVSPFDNDQAARASNGGALPPDLSLIAKARAGGPDYIYALLTGYQEEAPAGFDLADGMHYNDYFPGHAIAMAAPLSDDLVEYQDGTAATLEQQARDVTAFLMWAAEPKLEARKSLGVKVILYLLVFAGLLYVAKRRVWADAH